MFDVVISDEEDKMICYSKSYDEYGIIVPDGGPSYISMNYCPWCGEEFPKSKRDLWFDVIEKLGYEGMFDEDIPEILKTDEWHKQLPDVDNMSVNDIISALSLQPKLTQNTIQKGTSI
ncbi:MAG: hypothetical protein LBU57_01190 [Dysgonamonadaceae bacterium]|jgi:hypothetical protein|nr:hypothetical protein [Dysgonamonadaceae bacterium]